MSQITAATTLASFLLAIASPALAWDEPAPGVAPKAPRCLIDHGKAAELVVAATVEVVGGDMVTMRIVSTLKGEAAGDFVDVYYPNLWLEHGRLAVRPAYEPGDAVIAFLAGAPWAGLYVPVNPLHGTATRVLDGHARTEYKRRVKQLLNLDKELDQSKRDARAVEVLVRMVAEPLTRRDGLWMLDTSASKRAAFGWDKDYASMLTPRQLKRLRAVLRATHQGLVALTEEGAKGSFTKGIETGRLMVVIAQRMANVEAQELAREFLTKARRRQLDPVTGRDMLDRFVALLGLFVDGLGAAPGPTDRGLGGPDGGDGVPGVGGQATDVSAPQDAAGPLRTQPTSLR